MSQTQAAEQIRGTAGAVPAIENREVSASEAGTISTYIAALGGKLKIVADFGDEMLAPG